MAGIDPCTAELNTRLETQASFDAWRNSTSATLNRLSAAAPPITESNAELVAAEVDMAKTLACLNKKLTTVSSTSQRTSQLQESILTLQDAVRNEKENIAIAKDRVRYIRNPDENVSYYEGWFPLNRPLKSISVPILLGISLFFGLIILFNVLAYLGYEVGITVIGVSAPWFLWLMSQFTLSFWIVLALLIGTIWYFVGRK